MFVNAESKLEESKRARKGFIEKIVGMIDIGDKRETWRMVEARGSVLLPEKIVKE